MILTFTKMHGLGNDFVIVNALSEPLTILPPSIAALADRHFGIGFDQFLVIEPSSKADFFCRIYNANGSQAEQCGNGLRCVARYLHEENICQKQHFNIETIAGIFPIEIPNYQHICVTMGAPQIKEKSLALDIPEQDDALTASILSLGNPHAIIKVTSIESTNTTLLGSAISNHPIFPNGANVGFMQVIDANHILLRTYERGAGDTFACGSNACAAAVAGIVNGWFNHKVRIEFRFGSLDIEWQGENQPILMTGPASRVFSGKIDLEKLLD